METAIKNDTFINEKLISWEADFKINVQEADISFNYRDKKFIILKIWNVCKAENIRLLSYRNGKLYHLIPSKAVFLKILFKTSWLKGKRSSFNNLSYLKIIIFDVFFMLMLNAT